ncbi:hypothetical protein T440DRAFT_466930 [Plenodomus tracheiphilus IPT5]|uniref:Uncharacterized protein n=1 Tax=Plenodomus tracheiphilus IPT5 TaxID=1408161 RepID=A0A6A7BDJ9_9PLEO|nr:hypothetical protein T440DRAFT_466930 [Plenodomus tracheiphilus IPT5]
MKHGLARQRVLHLAAVASSSPPTAHSPPLDCTNTTTETMQSTTASRRLLSSLSSRIHPQLPLSPRESQQLLNLLTTSFRAHLDREHPLPAAEDNATTTRTPARNRNAPATPAASSYASTTRHLDSILTSPLFAVKPRRRGSESAAVDIIKDPMAWFVNEIAAGAATLPKAAMCLEMLQSSTSNFSQILTLDKSPATIFSAWLQNSGLETSRQFVEMSLARTNATPFLQRLMTLLVAEGDIAGPWRWFIRSSEHRTKETGLNAEKIAIFRRCVLWELAHRQANTSLNRGIATFMQACRFSENVEIDASYALLRPAGGRLVKLITSNKTESLDPELYQQFLQSTHRWTGTWNPAVQSMLWLHHPTESSALPGIRYIKDPATAEAAANLSRNRRQFVVQLCLGVARLSMKNERYADAQVAMQFTKDHFPELVLSEMPVLKQTEYTSEWRERREQENLELLNGLALT